MSETNLHGRSLARAQAFQILFQSDATGRKVEEIIADNPIISDGPLSDYAAKLALGTAEHRDFIDQKIRSVSDNWNFNRINNVDVNLLRLAIYEMCYVDDVDVAVTINEIVDLAKMFGTDDSSRFVNGILGRISRTDHGLETESASDNGKENELAEHINPEVMDNE